MTPGVSFGRLIRVTLGTRFRPNMAQYGNIGLESSPLRIGFDVKKSIKSAPNSATVTIYNMAPGNRSNIIPGMTLTLFAGYMGQLQLLFVGVVERAKSTRSGSEIATAIECLDGASAITGSLFMRAYGTQTTLISIFRDLAVRMAQVSAANPPGLSSATIIGVAASDTLNAVASFCGTCAEVLTKLCEPRGLEWSIQNGALQVIPKAHHSGEQAQLVSMRTGMIGVPSVNKDLCEFSCLLNPNLVPGRIVLLNARDTVGYYKIRGGKWSGDTHDARWQSDIEAVSLPDVAARFDVDVVSLPAAISRDEATV